MESTRKKGLLLLAVASGCLIGTSKANADDHSSTTKSIDCPEFTLANAEFTECDSRLNGVKIASKFPKIPATSAPGTKFKGNVSWYGPGFNGKLAACGKKFDMNKLTCAHKSLPFFTKVLVENPRNGKSCTIDVFDRGPYVGDRIIDLSRESARRLGTLTGGVAFVECLIVTEGGGGSADD